MAGWSEDFLPEMGIEWDLKDEEDSEKAERAWRLVCGSS